MDKSRRRTKTKKIISHSDRKSFEQRLGGYERWTYKEKGEDTKENKAASYAHQIGKTKSSTEKCSRSVFNTENEGIEILVELGLRRTNKGRFCEVTKGLIGEKTLASNVEPMYSLKIRDIYCLTKKAQSGRIHQS